MINNDQMEIFAFCCRRLMQLIHAKESPAYERIHIEPIHLSLAFIIAYPSYIINTKIEIPRKKIICFSELTHRTLLLEQRFNVPSTHFMKGLPACRKKRDICLHEQFRAWPDHPPILVKKS